MNSRTARVFLLASATLGGCATNPVPILPAPPVPLAWDTASDASTEISAAEFWRGFGSAPLQDLLQQAATANPDLLIAVNHLLIARAAEQAASAQRRPSVSLDAGPVDTTATAVNRSKRRDLAVYKLALHASYELDFWGRIDSLVASARAATEAVNFDLASARISIANQVAQHYFDIAEADEISSVLQQGLALADERLRLETARQSAGRMVGDAVIAAQIATDDRRAQVDQLRQQRRLHELQLALLLGRLPEQFHVEIAPLRQQVRLPPVPSSLTSQLLQRRPDVRAAEARLNAALANIGVVRAEQFPQLRLTAELGIATDVLRKALSGGVGLFGFGPELSLPIVDGGLRSAHLDASRREADIAWLDYRKAALAAFSDVETALLARQAALAQHDRSTAGGVQRQQQILRIKAQIDAGRKSRVDAIDAEQLGLDAELVSIHHYRAQLDSLLALFAALGGGWNTDTLAATP